MANIHDLVKKVKELAREIGGSPTKTDLMAAGISDWAIRRAGGMNEIVKAAGLETYNGISSKREFNLPKILVVDIETAPILAYVWGLWDQTVGLNQVKRDWHLMSWSAKWLGKKEVFYRDQRAAKDIENDKEILQPLWGLINEADIVLGQNSTRFDVKKLNARFLHHGFPPPAPYRQIDTQRIAKKHFGFTSNKLAYMSEKFCSQFKKLSHSKFSGFELWRECMAGNLKAWEEMRKYNIQDVKATEELYRRFAPWDNSISWNVYHDHFDNFCFCGSTSFHNEKLIHTNVGRYVSMSCKKCGKPHTIKENLLSKEKRKALVK